MSNSVQQVLQLLVGPLRYGARDGFAHIGTLRDFERTLRSVVDRARAAGGNALVLDRILAHGQGFDSAPPPARRAAVEAIARELGRLMTLPTELAAIAHRPSSGPAPVVPKAGEAVRPRQSTPQRETPPETVKKRPVAKSAKPARRTRRKSASKEAEAGEQAAESSPAYLPAGNFVGPLATDVKSLGPRGRLAGALTTRGFKRVGELLFYLPRAYEDRRKPVPIGRLPIGQRGLAIGTIRHAGEVTMGRRRMFRAVLADQSGTIVATWYAYQSWIRSRYQVGQRWAFSGEIRTFNGMRTVAHPEMEPAEELEGDTVNFGRIVPIYPGFERTDQRGFRNLCHRAVEQYARYVEDPLPARLLERVKLPPLSEAVREIHFPSTAELEALDAHETPQQRRFAFDELFFIQLGLALRRKGVKLEPGVQFRVDEAMLEKARARLPFQPTRAQIRAVRQIAADMAKPEPMNRLLQGDVGSGKTAVALMCASIAIENGYQVALMAPTEILAEQHQRNLSGWLASSGHRSVLLSAGLKKREKDEAKALAASGEAHVVIGTHALIQGDVTFDRLGLVIIDEQHRFGVLQRAQLMNKGIRPDVLVMTATPIPRTLAMVLYSDLELSVLDELPPGRTPVITRVFRDRQRDQVFALMRREMEKGRQAYVIYPLVEESEKLDLASATEGAQELAERFPGRKVGLLHGRMGPEEKDAIMADFRSGAIHILVSTTVVEVGVDVPNATVMVVVDAERFGLSQLHQLRGRVGRGSEQSYCCLVGGDHLSDVARQRLAIMERTSNGFEIAEEDLKLRGPGEFLGTRQSGVAGLTLADLTRDVDLLEIARTEAQRIVDEDPHLERPEHAALRRALEQRWEGKLGLARVG